MWIKTKTKPAQLVNAELTKTITIIEKSANSYQIAACYDDYEIPLAYYDDLEEAKYALNELWEDGMRYADSFDFNKVPPRYMRQPVEVLNLTSNELSALQFNHLNTIESIVCNSNCLESYSGITVRTANSIRKKLEAYCEKFNR